MNLFNSEKLGINAVLTRSFLLSGIVVIIVTIVGAIYIDNRNLQILSQANMQKTHEVLSDFLVPDISIMDIVDARRVLSLVSDKNEIFAVVNRSGDIILPDYQAINLVKSVYRGNPVSCHGIQGKYQFYQGYNYSVSCSVLQYKDLSQTKTVGILISFSKKPVWEISTLAYYFFGLVLLSLLLITIWFRSVLHKRLVKPLVMLGTTIVEAARSPLEHEVSMEDIKHSPSEIKAIKDSFHDVLMHLKYEYAQRIDTEKKIAMFDVAARVAHDIRSPLAVMEMNLHLLGKDVPKYKTIMLHEAAQSLRDISNNLLDRYRNENYSLDTAENLTKEQNTDYVVRPVLFHSLIESVISQKRHEWQDSNCLLEFIPDAKAKMLWVKIAPNEMRCVLSNLLNNAFEAITSNGKIVVTIELVDTLICLSIADNGCGIPLDKINDVLSGVSLKHSGKGIGLSSAKTYILSLGGKLEIHSSGHGSIVFIKIQQSMKPEWFPSGINLYHSNSVIVIDDDPAMLSLWQHRLSEYNVVINKFLSIDDAKAWMNTNVVSALPTYLIDYELSGSESGLDFLKSFKLNQNAYLVTSHADDIAIQNAATSVGVWLLPKAVASDIGISISLLTS